MANLLVRDSSSLHTVSAPSLRRSGMHKPMLSALLRGKIFILMLASPFISSRLAG